jgi:hypothetical protein
MPTETQTAPKDFGWCLLELMGHRQRIGKICEEEIAGNLLLRVDIPVGNDTDAEDYVTEYYGSNAVYAMRPVSEEVARGKFNVDPRPPRPAEYRPAPQIAHHYDDDEDESLPI